MKEYNDSSLTADLGKWDLKNITADLSDWNLENATDLSKWDLKNVTEVKGKSCPSLVTADSNRREQKNDNGKI